jgi:hypothetical protein
MAVNSSEVSGALHRGVKKGTIANTTSKTDSSAAVAGWIVANIYDTERAKGENRLALIDAIALALALYKGDV